MVGIVWNWETLDIMTCELDTGTLGVDGGNVILWLVWKVVTAVAVWDVATPLERGEAAVGPG